MFSQNQEEKFILDVFKDQSTGKFIDIGAYHVERFSNTRALYLKGFKGVFVEPQPVNYAAIADHYKDDPDITVLNVAIGPENGIIDFYESDGDAVGTSDILHRDKWGAAGVKYSKIQVEQVSVEDFMNEHCHGVDMLSIDTEATNLSIFRKIPDWVWQQIKLLVIEHDTLTEEIESKLIPFGFKTLYTNAENIVMARVSAV